VALALLKSGDKDAAAGGGAKHPLKARLRAWWEGYELRPLAEVGEEAVAEGVAAADDAAAEENVPEWSEGRQKLVQLIWGEGFAAPGGPEHVVDLAQPFGLTAENTMLEIGSGPGGGACAVADKIGSYVDGFDLSEDLVKQALEASMMKGLDAKAKVKQFDPETFELKKNFYDGCLMREVLIAIEDKDALLEIALNAIKPGKPIVVTEMFVTSAEPGPLAAASLDGEFGDVYPCEVAPILAKIEEMDFEVRVNADETEEYTAKARAAWSGLAERIAGEELDEGLADALLRETKLWDRRNEAYAAGELQMRRIVAFKNTSVS
jgi:SAM-dependent methyltransferase